MARISAPTSASIRRVTVLFREKLDGSGEGRSGWKTWRMKRRATAVVLVAGLAVCATACGGGSQTTTTQPGHAETAQKLPKLPPGWKAHRDRSVGYAIGLPTGWQVSGHGSRVLFRPPDHLVAVTLTADRRPGAVRLSLKRFAAQALG